MNTTPEQLRQEARAVREAQRQLGAAAPETRTRVLRALARLLEARRAEIREANLQDVAAAEAEGLAGPLLGRLKLTDDKLATLVEGVAQLASQTDPIGQVVRATELDDEVVLTQVQSPLGVLLIIFESRPDAVIQIGSLALRSGNGVILKGGREALHSNRMLVACLREALTSEGLPAGAVLGVEGREAVAALLEFDADIDLVIPRGSGELVRSIQASTRIPVMGHAEGVCHLYLDAAADPEMAEHLAVDGKCDYPSACNATETVLVHRDFLSHLPRVVRALLEAGVEVRADSEARRVIPETAEATDADWRTEYGDLTVAVRVVDSLDAAIEHIHRYGSAHTESIVTADPAAAERFLREVDAASVFHNVSTRFADGYRFGLGAEVGVSTGRLHARGPVGVEGLLTTRWLVRGRGEGAGDYGPGKRRFTHRSLDPTTASPWPSSGSRS